MARLHLEFGGLMAVTGFVALALSGPVAGEAMLAHAPADPSAHVAIMANDMAPQPRPAFTERTVRRHADGLFYVEAQANGQPIRFVVDTGATVVVLNREDAAKLGLSFESLRSGGSMRTAGGASAMRWARIERLEMAGKRIEQLHAAVVETGLPVSLMGQNALEQLGTVTLRGDTLTID